MGFWKNRMDLEKMKKYKPNNKGLKILTDDGYQSFDGIAYMGDKPIYRLEFENDYWLECTEDHKIYVDDEISKQAIDIEIGDNIKTLTGDIHLKNKSKTGRIEPVYDIIGVNPKNRFYGNNILVSNCEFVSYEETLINSIFLTHMKDGIEPKYKLSQIRWYDDIKPDQTYIVALDPSLGTGGDNAAIEVISLPDLKQVAEWQHNLTPIKGQIHVLRDICDYIHQQDQNVEIYWSVENNTIGEAALVTISELGEENIQGYFLSQPRRVSGIKSRKKYRKGFTTTNQSKIAACSRLKNWVESEKLKLNSKNILRELRTFVARGVSYKAMDGETDDLIMALLLAIRMIEVVSRYDEDNYEELRDTFDDYDEDNEPMPVFVI